MCVGEWKRLRQGKKMGGRIEVTLPLRVTWNDLSLLNKLKAYRSLDCSLLGSFPAFQVRDPAVRLTALASLNPRTPRLDCIWLITFLQCLVYVASFTFPFFIPRGDSSLSELGAVFTVPFSIPIGDSFQLSFAEERPEEEPPSLLSKLDFLVSSLLTSADFRIGPMSSLDSS